MGRGITQANNDTVVAVGYGNGNLGGQNLGRSDAYVIAYATTGERLWADRFGTPELDTAEAITTAPGGTICITGALNGRSTDVGSTYFTGETWFVAAYTPNGQQLWLQQYAAGDISEKVE